MRNARKAVLALAFAVFGTMFFLLESTPASAAAEEGDCIRAEYIVGETCFGATTRMCKGPPECFPTEVE